MPSHAQFRGQEWACAERVFKNASTASWHSIHAAEPTTRTYSTHLFPRPPNPMCQRQPRHRITIRSKKKTTSVLGPPPPPPPPGDVISVWARVGGGGGGGVFPQALQSPLFPPRARPWEVGKGVKHLAHHLMPITQHQLWTVSTRTGRGHERGEWTLSNWWVG